MIDPQPNRTFRGNFEEVFSHRNEIPAGATLELKVFAPDSESEEEIGEFGGKSVYDMFKDVIGIVSFEPTDLGRRAEEYLEGFGETKRQAEP